MADLDYTSALGDLNFAPAENYYGIGAQSIAQALPSLTNPYASPLSNLGVTLGGALVASLLGYQARKEANDLSLQTQRYANQLLRAETPEARVSFLESLPSDVLESGVGTRLSRLSTALAQQQAIQNALIGQEVAKKKALAEFELSETGQQIQQNQLKQAALVAGIQSGLIPAEYESMFKQESTEGIPQIPGLTPKQSQQVYIDRLKTEAAQQGSEGAKQQRNAVETVKDLEKTFRDLNMNAAEFKYESVIPGSKAELAFSKLKGSLAALARVSGQTSQLSDVDLQQQLDSILGPTVPGLGMISGTSSIADRLKSKLTSAPGITGQAPNTQIAGKNYYNSLIAKYGSDWKSKITDSEKTTLKALLDAAKGQ